MFDDQDSIETAALIDSCDDLQNRAEQVTSNVTGDGCTRVVAGFIVAGFWLLVLVWVVT
jgi:hypothetical protein